MRALRLAVLTLSLLGGFPTTPFAKNLQDIIKQLPGPLPGLAQSAITKVVESEWNKLPPNELACVTQKLRERGDSVQSLAQRGVFPLDTQVANLRSECRASSAPPVGPVVQPIAQPAPSQPPPETTQTGIGEFARIVSIPNDCQTARELRRAELRQRARAFANSELCRAVLNCFEMVRSQARAGVDFLKRNPGVDRAFHDQLRTMNPHDPRVDGWLRNLEQRLSFFDSVASVPSYSDCSHRGQFIDEWVTVVHPPSSPLKGLFDPSRGLFEKFSVVGQAVLTNAQIDYKSIEAEYRDLISFNDKYAGVERFETAQAAYRSAFENDDLAAMIRERPNVLQEMEEARGRKLLLSKQTEELTSFEKHFSDLTALLTQESIAKLVSPDVPELSAKLKSQARIMLDMPPRLRGDVDTTLKELSLRENELQNKSAAAQAKLDNLKRRDERRIDALKDIATILPGFADLKIQQRLGPRASMTLVNLHDRQIELLKYSNVPPVDQLDYDDALNNANKDIEMLKGVLTAIRQIDDVLERIRALKAILDKSGLREPTTLSAVDGLSNTMTLLRAKSLPLTGADETQLSEAWKAISQLEKDIPAIIQMHERQLEADKKAEKIKQKGEDYATRRETYWRSTSKRNEMSDRVDVYTESIQKNGQGAVAYVMGYCDKNAITFSAVIVDEAGKPTVDIPFLFNAGGQIRINDQDPEQYPILLKGSFKNELRLVSLYSTQPTGPMSLSETWRVFVHFDTSMGEMLLKRPIYEPSVQEMIRSCP